MNNKDYVLCECHKCKKNGIGKYVHFTTKWRHSRKRKYNTGLNELIDNDIGYYNEKYGDCDDNDDSDKDYEIYNRSYSEVDYFKK
jgi:hypothetical protein